ncbi:pentatricopeptide repeat-containing protein At1g52640, mitochondrial [Malania oleifera]|uniref:pentatricopeptide repeat-containing protein At1g52640, mitochondrial n=1 Tax=Malania oleifera TaxID=397392 RepID=UPI0025ADA3E7|nr:pentatricopeptide repeat-containing protein At1g52640, mitochondrial [Malania oleifera]
MAIRPFASRSKAFLYTFHSFRSSHFSHPHKACLSLLASPSSHPSNTHFFRPFTHSHDPPPPDQPSSPEEINEICRILSDFRRPHHDIDPALAPFSSKMSSNLVEQVLKRCKNLAFSAHRFFLWAQRIKGFNHSRESYHILIDVLGSSRQFPLVWDFLSEMRETRCCEISPQIFRVIFRAYSRANLPLDAIRAFNKMADFGIKPGLDDLDQLLYVLCKRNHVKHAQQFFDRVKLEFEPSAKTYSILMNGWGEVSDPNEARKLFDEMLERGCLVDVLTYNCLLKSLCKGGNLDEAYKVFREIRSKGLEPDAWSYSIFIHASCDRNDIHSTFRVLDRMKRYNLVPNVYTYNHIIKTLCKSGKVEEAYQLLDEMIERGARPDVCSYNAIQAFHCDHCEVNKALRLISRMDNDYCVPDRHTYNMVLKMLIRVGRFDRVMEVWKGMEERGFYPSVSTYAVMIHGLCQKRGKLEEACEYFEMMIDEGLPPYPCTIELLRNRLLGLRFLERIQVLAEKMERSTSCSIQELSNTMRGDKTCGRLRSEEQN